MHTARPVTGMLVPTHKVHISRVLYTATCIDEIAGAFVSKCEVHLVGLDAKLLPKGVCREVLQAGTLGALRRLARPQDVQPRAQQLEKVLHRRQAGNRTKSCGHHGCLNHAAATLLDLCKPTSYSHTECSCWLGFGWVLQGALHILTLMMCLAPGCKTPAPPCLARRW
jgi:hypothetical protein